MPGTQRKGNAKAWRVPDSYTSCLPFKSPRSPPSRYLIDCREEEADCPTGALGLDASVASF
jgi:hypothetical protein